MLLRSGNESRGRRKEKKNTRARAYTCTYRLLIHAIALFPSSADVQNCCWKHPARAEGDDSSSDTSCLFSLIIHGTLFFLPYSPHVNGLLLPFMWMLKLRTRMIKKFNRAPVFNFANFNNKLADRLDQITSWNLYSNLLSSSHRGFPLLFFFHFRIRLCSAEFVEIYGTSQQSWLMHCCIVARQVRKSRIQVATPIATFCISKSVVLLRSAIQC